MAKLKFILNGNNVESESGLTVLEAAEQHGIVIPTLCHDPRLKPTAACRLCLVEIQGAKGPMPACATSLSAGMVINTHTDNIFKLRKTALELLLSDHYGDCIAPCKQACPAGIDIQGYIAHIANGQYREALKLIKETNPLPLVCGRVCPRFCEKKCRRNLVDEPVAINFLKRFVADFDLNGENIYRPDIKAASGHKVAIIGGGPSGLTAAYYLAIEGHYVAIFDSSPQLGGMLRYGIPEYRLPKAILDKEIDSIINLCAEVHLNSELGRDYTIDSLKQDGFEAIYIALGAQSSQKMQVKGEDLPGVISGIDFLGNVILNKKIELGSRVAIVGGGNTAIDAARTALRLGAQRVSIVYRRSREEMPANDEEIEQAEIEGVQFVFLAAPQKIIAKNGKAGSLLCLKMRLGEPDSSGRRKPETVPGSEFNIEIDTIIAAIGQSVDASGIPQEAIEKKRTIGINKNTMETPIQGVFSGGDCVTGPATAVEAIGAGKKAAISISQYLDGQLIVAKSEYNCSKGELHDIDVTDYNNIPRIPRISMPALSLQKREHNFKEVDLGFNEEMALNESTRCLSCGCQDVFECKLRQLATEYKVEDKHYAGKKHHLPIIENEHQHIIRDENKCILCGRCVRICSEVEGISALGFINRGFNTGVGPAINMPLSETMCESCGQCVSTCPTGAFQDKINLVKQGPWKTDVVSSVCPYCSIGCSLELNIAGNKLVTVTSPLNSPVNNGNLCKKGKYDCIDVNKIMRLATPLVNRDDQLVETSWKDVIELTRNEILTINKQGSNKVAVLVSGMLTNEESYLIQKMARIALGTNNIVGMTGAILKEGYVRTYEGNEIYCSLDDIGQSDLIITIGGDITQSYPIVASKVREAVSQGSTKLITISPETTRLAAISKVDLKVNARTTLALLRAIVNYIINYNLVDHEFIKSNTRGFEKLITEMEKFPFQDIVELFWVKPAKIVEAIHLYIQAKRPVIVVNTDNIKSEELSLLSDLALITGNMNREGSGIITLRTPGNAQGLLDMGVHPVYLPGFGLQHIDSVREKFKNAWKHRLPEVAKKDTEDIIEGIRNGEFEGLLVFGIDAIEKLGKDIFSNVKFSLLMSNSIPEDSPYPNVIIPMASFTESNGTFTNCEHRIQYLNRAILPMSCKQNWEIIAALSNVLGCSMNYSGIQEIRAEISRLVLGYKFDITNVDGKGILLEKCESRQKTLHLERSVIEGDNKVLKAVNI